MGGEVLKLASDKIREESLEKGIEEGVNLLAQAIDKLRAGVPFDDVKAQYGEDIANCAQKYR